MIPAQFSAYFTCESLISLLGFIVFGLAMSTLSTFEFGRQLLLKNPEFFSFGYFKKSGPTQEQIDGTTFVSRQVGTMRIEGRFKG